ncbi:hypothetical protein BCR33DRAFT_795499, partial [Rhizoclosmatium globosum]
MSVNQHPPPPPEPPPLMNANNVLVVLADHHIVEDQWLNCIRYFQMGADPEVAEKSKPCLPILTISAHINGYVVPSSNHINSVFDAVTLAKSSGLLVSGMHTIAQCSLDTLLAVCVAAGVHVLELSLANGQPDPDYINKCHEARVGKTHLIVVTSSEAVGVCNKSIHLVQNSACSHVCSTEKEFSPTLVHSAARHTQPQFPSHVHSHLTFNSSQPMTARLLSFVETTTYRKEPPANGLVAGTVFTPAVEIRPFPHPPAFPTAPSQQAPLLTPPPCIPQHYYIKPASAASGLQYKLDHQINRAQTLALTSFLEYSDFQIIGSIAAEHANVMPFLSSAGVQRFDTNSWWFLPPNSAFLPQLHPPSLKDGHLPKYLKQFTVSHLKGPLYSALCRLIELDAEKVFAVFKDNAVGRWFVAGSRTMKSMENDALALSRCLSHVVNANPPLSVPVESKFKYTPPPVYVTTVTALQNGNCFCGVRDHKKATNQKICGCILYTIGLKNGNCQTPTTPSHCFFDVMSTENKYCNPNLRSGMLPGNPHTLKIRFYPTVKLPLKTILAGADWLRLEFESVLPKINLISTIATKFGTNLGLRMFHKSKKGVPMLQVNELFFVSIIETVATDGGKVTTGQHSQMKQWWADFKAEAGVPQIPTLGDDIVIFANMIIY